MNKATELITSEHREVEQLFARFEETGDRSVAMQICDLLDRHTEMEEQVLYPELERVDQQLYEDAQQEHDEADGIIQQIRQADGDRLTDLVQELKESVQHHVEDEESEDLPAMEESCGVGRMDELGEQMLRWRSSRGGDGGQEQLGDYSYASDGSSDGRTKDDLLDLTKDELYEKAKEADVSGRSNMSKEQLAEELSEH